MMAAIIGDKVKYAFPILLLTLCGSWNLVHGLQSFGYQRADSIAFAYKDYPLHNLKALSDSLTQDLSSDTEKFRAIYTWVCTNIKGDYSLVSQQKEAQTRLSNDSIGWHKWQQTFNKKVFKRLLSQRKTLCSGFAYLIHQLSYHAGIKTKIITGYGRTARANVNGNKDLNHAWNAVLLSGKWYLCDATWSSGSFTTPGYRFNASFNDVYFLTDPQLFIQDHYPEDSQWTLLDTIVSPDAFFNAPVVYASAYKYHIRHNWKHPESSDGKLIIEMISWDNIQDQITVRVKSSGKLKYIPISIDKKKDTYYIQISAWAYSGMDLHVFVQDQPVLSYPPANR